MRYFLFIAVMLATAPALAQELPADPGATPLAEADNWVVGTLGKGDIEGVDDLLPGDVYCQRVLSAGFEIMTGGLLMAEKKAARAAEYKIAYTELRLLYSIDIKAWAMKESVYKDEIGKCQAEVKRLSKPPSFWQANKGIIGFIIGVAFGAATAIGIAYGIGDAN